MIDMPEGALWVVDDSYIATLICVNLLELSARAKTISRDYHAHCKKCRDRQGAWGSVSRSQFLASVWG